MSSIFLARSRGQVGVVAAVLLCAIGCSTPDKPYKTAPATTRPVEQQVKLRSHGALFITKVDFWKIPGVKAGVLGQGGNTVLISPGKHKISFDLESGYSSGSGAFVYDFQPGIEYSFGPGEWGVISHVTVIDETHKTKVMVATTW